MFTVIAVLCGVAGVWVAMGGGPGARLRPPPAPRAPLPGRLLVLSAAGAGAVALAGALFGVLGAVVAAVAGAVWWTRVRGREREGRIGPTGDVPVVIGLIAAGMRAGAPLPSCLAAVARAAPGRLGEELASVAERLRLGADPGAAWAEASGTLPEPLVAVGRDLARAADTGAPVADLLDRHVSDLHRELRSRAAARVERLGVLVVMPLALCFLPSFLLVGVVPMVADLLSRALGG
ncbi:Type II secretion system (T2SS), protein F [Nocardiopsis flavescens]|uniref:Type II secretion system (T2SS), protein F n=1 Tax=Nocardiopsis flavescens TaxID=758803 RepID=A0A1M6RX05_9ACTN|nr:type II secretion system F family protein [Nocardiopsis flavescens]SHK36993.1 Type II secretion system (T2SS), protein F [Nocardiopsis flavescens]